MPLLNTLSLLHNCEPGGDHNAAALCITYTNIAPMQVTERTEGCMLANPDKHIPSREGEERRRPAQSPVYPQAEQSHQLPFLSSRINFLAPFPTFAGPSRDTSNPLPEQQQLVPGRSPPPPIRATVYHFIIVIHQLQVHRQLLYLQKDNHFTERHKNNALQLFSHSSGSVDHNRTICSHPGEPRLNLDLTPAIQVVLNLSKPSGANFNRKF